MTTNRFIQRSSSLAMIPAPPTPHLLHRVQSRLRARSSASHAPDLTYLLHAARRLKLQIDFRTDDIIAVRNPRTGIYYNFLSSYTDFDGLASLRIAADKIYCYRLMQRLQLPVPRHIIVPKNEWIRSIAFSRQCPGGIAIQPARNIGDGFGVCILPGHPMGGISRRRFCLYLFQRSAGRGIPPRHQLPAALLPGRVCCRQFPPPGHRHGGWANIHLQPDPGRESRTAENRRYPEVFRRNPPHPI